MQSFFIGVGAAVANELPDIFSRLGVAGTAANGVPLTVLYAFKLGAGVFLSAVLWTVATSKEYPPADMADFQRRRRETKGYKAAWPQVATTTLLGLLFGVSRGALIDGELGLWQPIAGAGIGAVIGMVLSGPEVSAALKEMPATMKQLAAVQCFTWLGLFCMWMFFGLATAQQVFGTLDPKSPKFDEGTVFAGQTFAWYSVVCFLVAFLLAPLAARIGRKRVHALALTLGGLSLLATGFLHDRTLWQATMIGVGIAWASILAMPYAMLSSALPAARMGVYMGIFNFFIVLPEILASRTLEPVVKQVFHNDPVKVVMLGGASLLVAAALALRVKDRTKSA
jgi:maltose/moltooligosaccharide transporter